MGIKTTMNRGLLIITLLFWGGIGAVVLEHNLAPFGHSKLRWNNPVRTTAHFQWHQKPTQIGGKVVIPAGKTRRFSVTLPRGFDKGDLKVKFEDLSGRFGMVLEAGARPPIKIQSESELSPIQLVFSWSDLIARGQKFDFSLTNPNQSPVAIHRIDVTAIR